MQFCTFIVGLEPGSSKMGNILLLGGGVRGVGCGDISRGSTPSHGRECYIPAKCNTGEFYVPQTRPVSVGEALISGQEAHEKDTAYRGV